MNCKGNKYRGAPMDQLIVINRHLKCHFCGFKRNDYLRYGPIYRLGNIRAHYYCVLLSNKLHQNGKDNEGMLGFLLSDIQNELQRTLNLICIYCGRGNATITCAAKKCRKTFHLPCGLKNGSLHQFVKEFKSFCRNHRPSQNIPEKIRKEVRMNGAMCCICYDMVNLEDKANVLWAPCCLKTWYHRYCVQKLAHSAGYFFRCAACNDVKKFNDCMERFGIFVPKQDASWELVPNAFVELLFRYDRCDAENCKCPEGRQKNAENTVWEIVLCESCGSQGMHIACGNLKFLEPEWECPDCEEITKNLKPSATKVQKSAKAGESSSVILNLPEVSHKKRRRSCEDLENSVLDKRKKCRTNLMKDKDDEEEEIEIDVETIEEPEEKETQTEEKDEDHSDDVFEVGSVEKRTNKKEDFQEVLTSLKPGPLSYKLSLLRKALKDCTPLGHGNENVRTRTTVIDLIHLSDSEKEVDDEIEIIEESRRQTSCHSNMRYLQKQEVVEMSENETCDGTISLQKIMKVQRECLSHSEEVTGVSNDPLKNYGHVKKVGNQVASMICYLPSAKECPRNLGCGCHSKPIKTDNTKEIKSAMMIEDEVIILTD